MDHPFPIAFGKYILLKSLAKGGMGEIFLALTGEIDGFEKLCVIKKVRADNPSLVGRFLDEGKVVVKLSHGNLVQVFDVGIVNNEVYLAMEYVEGRDLRDMMVRCDQTKTRVPIEVALYVTMQICRGLQYAHRYGDLRLVHRDICPSNVLVSYFGEVKVTDFGLAQSVLKEELTQPGKVFGRFSYLAPEQVEREGVDLRTDIYATGIILWELLVGQQLRAGVQDDPVTALSVIRSGKVTPPSIRNQRVSADLDAIVLKALQMDRKDRFTSMEEMQKGMARVAARLNPGFEAGGVASFVRHLFGSEIDEARKQRERFLARDYSKLKNKRVSVKGISSPGVEKTDTEDGDLTGQVLDGRYRVTRLLGEGGMGAVYEAEHMEIGRRVALKILHSVFSSHPETMARFRQEARAATLIGHPNIVEVTDSGVTEDGRLYFVMELLSGVDLAQVMAKQRIVPARRSLRITLQICKALHAAHEAGVIHRDLKPENIFLIEREGKGDFVKLLDFGIAKNIELVSEEEGEPRDQRLTHPGMAMGTPEYMAPEQAAGGDIDRRIDVYATGAMLYEMLTGHLPHEGKNLMQVLSKKASEPPIPPRRHRPRMPSGLEEVILRALATDRDARYSTMEEMGTSLLSFLAPGASEWAEAETPSDESGEFYRPESASGAVVVASEAGTDPSATDPTVPAPGLLQDQDGPTEEIPQARVVSPGEVKLSNKVVPVARTVVPMEANGATEAPDLAMASTTAMPTIPRRRIWVAIVVVGLVVTLAAVGGYALWKRRTDLPAVPDAGLVSRAPDAAVKPKPKPKPKPKRRKLTPEEVERLVEWARRAADGRRYTRPKGDNVRELLARVERDYPDHPSVVKLRQRVIHRIERSSRVLARRRKYAAAERRLRAWLVLDPEAEKPKVRLALIAVAQGRRHLARRKTRMASIHAKAALKWVPGSPSAWELLGDIATKKRNLGHALKAYEQAMKAEKIGRRQKRRLKKKIKKTKRKLK